MMKAVIHTKYGSPDFLNIKEINVAKPKANELLIKVHATTVNRTDCAMLRAKPFIMRFFSGMFKPKNPILGTDFAGEVTEIGKAATKYKIGDRVFGFNDLGLSSHAQYLTISEDQSIAKMPERYNYKEVVASIEGAHYARNMLNKVSIKADEKALVNGATGAIGSACVQLLKYYGLNVTAVCDGKHVELIKSIGADEVIDYKITDFTKSGFEFDYIFDAVGKSTFSKCKPILKKGGVYISSELGPWSQNLFYSLFTPLFNSKKVKFPFPTNIPESIDLVKDLMEKEAYFPVIDKVYTIDEIREAFKYVESGNKIANVIVTYF